MTPTNTRIYARHDPAGPTDAFGSRFDRVAAYTGGQIGFVNFNLLVDTHVGPAAQSYEWGLMARMNNNATAGENCASYAQANKLASGKTWAFVSEVCDTSGQGAAVSQEVDVWTTGHDNGNRIGLDIAVGDSKVIRKLGQSDACGATAAVRCGASTGVGDDVAYWSFGAWLTAIKDTGVRVVSRAAGAVRGVHLIGKYVVGIDLGDADCQTAIRLRPGQTISLEPTDQHTLSYLGGRLMVKSGGVETFAVDVPTGNVFKNGVKVL